MADEDEEGVVEIETIDETGNRMRVIAFVGVGFMVAAVAVGTFVLDWREKTEVAQTGPTQEELAALDVKYGRVDGVDYAAEMEIEFPDADVASDDEEAAPAAPSHMGKVFNLDPFVVNIRDGERDRYLKLKADLELSADEVSDELQQRLPQVRDLIISLLGGKSFEDLRTIEGKNFLREEILLRVNALLVTGKAKRIFFTEFVVQ